MDNGELKRVRNYVLQLILKTVLVAIIVKTQKKYKNVTFPETVSEKRCTY